jgi:hypothetical protein
VEPTSVVIYTEDGTRPQLVDLDLTASEIKALANLADGRGRTISELGAAMGAAQRH